MPDVDLKAQGCVTSSPLLSQFLKCVCTRKYVIILTLRALLLLFASEEHSGVKEVP